MHSPYRDVAAVVIVLSLIGGTAAADDPLARARLQIQGSRLTIYGDAQTNDAEQVINIGEQARVRTCYGGADAPCGSVAAGDPRIQGLNVIGDLRGPELPETLQVSTVPGGTFVLPSFQRNGEYVLANIRLVNVSTGAVLGLADPPSATLHVLQIAVPSASVSRLSLADLQARGIQISQENFQAYRFALGFAVGGGTVTIDLPVLYDGAGTATPLEPPEVYLDGLSDSVRSAVERWQPPSIIPFVLEPSICDPERDEWCREQEVENHPPEFPIFGAIIVPGTVSFLNQFFDAKLLVANAAPAGSDVVLDDLVGSLRLPAANALRLAATEPPIVSGQQVPLLDVLGGRAVAAEAQASASWTVEGLKAGTHALQWDIAGKLKRPGRATMPVACKAQGVVEVVDARFHLTFSHPDVVREGEAYTLFVTVTNLSRTTQNDVTVSLIADQIEGAHKGDPNDDLRRRIVTLAAGESVALEYCLVSDVTGQVFATTFQAEGPQLGATIGLHTGVGELGIPLSPATLVLPRFAERLGRPYLETDDLLRANVRLLGLAHSLATAPAGTAPPGIPVVTTPAVERRAIDLAEAGRRTFLHDGVLESLEVLALDQLGNRNPLAAFDELRRRSEKGAAAATALAGLLRQKQASRTLDALALFDHLAETTSYAPRYLAAVVTPAGYGAPPELEIMQTVGTETRSLAGSSDDAGRHRGIPFGEIYAVNELASGGATLPLAVIGHVESTDLFRVRLDNDGGSPKSGRLVVVVPGPGPDPTPTASGDWTSASSRCLRVRPSMSSSDHRCPIPTRAVSSSHG